MGQTGVDTLTGGAGLPMKILEGAGIETEYTVVRLVVKPGLTTSPPDPPAVGDPVSLPVVGRSGGPSPPPVGDTVSLPIRRAMKQRSLDERIAALPAVALEGKVNFL